MNILRKAILFLLIIILHTISLHAQSVFSVTHDQFETAIRAEMAKHIGGEYLYNHSESYQRMIKHIVRKELGLTKRQGQSFSPLSANSDTSTVFDPDVDPQDQDETSVAINRVNTSTLCIGANDNDMYDSGMPVYTSTDKGSSWSVYRLPQPPGIPGTTFTALGDPIIATDDNGNFYYAYLGGVSGSNIVGNISVAISQDGIEWSNGTPININKSITGTTDKEHISVDCSPTSPYYGRVYVVWYEFYTDGLHTGEGLNIAWSNDKCKTWSKPVPLGQGDNFQEIKTNSKGDIFVSFTDSYSYGQELLVSTDGGKTFSQKKIPISPNTQFSLYPYNRNDVQSLKGANGFRSFPYIAFDINLMNDRIQAVYGNYEDVSGQMTGVLYYAMSDDNGTKWSSPQYLGISNPLHASLAFDRFHPWVSIDQKTGEAWSLYYSSEEDSQNILSAAYRMKLSDQLSDYPEMLHQLFDPTIVETSPDNSFPFIGDYNGSDAFDSIYIATWTENRPNNSDGEVFAYITYPKAPGSLSSVGNTTVVRSNTIWLSSPYPNPVKGNTISLNYYVPYTSDISFDLLDVNGKLFKHFSENTIKNGSYTEKFDLSNIPSGTYLLRMSSESSQQTRKIIVD
jgi:hypothetical protein